VVNIVVLFLVCMMSLQAPVRRGEERFKLNEPIWIVATSGALSTGRIKDISLTGVAIVADENRAIATKSGENARVFITEVGFVSATVVRQTGRFLAVHFDLPPSVERDLLIRKLFTSGLDATTVTASALSSTRAMLMSIWHAAGKRPEIDSETATRPALATDKLPAESLVVLSKVQPERLAVLAANRSAAA
ncbi:MAG: PilZ domain-containing protein, partial [Tardiphaga sp.]